MFEVLKGGKEPEMGSEFSGCIDLFAREDVVISAGETNIVPLGIKIDIERLMDSYISNNSILIGGMLGHTKEEVITKFMKSHVLKLHIRSSTTLMENEEKPQWKHLHIANGTGVVDLDYEDEIGIILHKPITMGAVLELVTSFFGAAFQAMKTGTCPGFNMKTDALKTVVKAGDKIAQIELCEHKTFLLGYSTKKKRVAGYGSTGV